MGLVSDRLKELSAEKLHDTLRKSDLLVKRCQYVFSRDWSKFAENYARGDVVIYIRVTFEANESCKYCDPFLVVREGVVPRGPDSHLFKAKWHSDTKSDSISNDRIDNNQVHPMFIGVSDLVHSPEKVIPSGVWFLGFNREPLISREFLFYSTLHSPTWKFIRLSIGHPTEWESNPGSTPIIAINQSHSHLVECGAQMANGFDQLESDVFGQVFVAVCDYVKCLPLLIDLHGVRLGSRVGVDNRLQVDELALSSSDLFF